MIEPHKVLSFPAKGQTAWIDYEEYKFEKAWLESSRARYKYIKDYNDFTLEDLEQVMKDSFTPQQIKDFKDWGKEVYPGIFKFGNLYTGKAAAKQILDNYEKNNTNGDPTFGQPVITSADDVNHDGLKG